MNPMHDDLRELLDAAIGEPPRRVTAQAVRRRAVRRRMARAGGMSAAVAVAAAFGIVLSSGAIGFGASPVTGQAGRPGPPRFYLAQTWDSQARQNVWAVRATATGRITAVVGSPQAHAACGGGNLGIAAAGHQTFFMTCVATTSAPAGQLRPGKITSILTRIYRFQVTGSGRISGYTPVSGGVFRGLWPSTIAASPDGSAVAVEMARPLPSGRLMTNTVPAGIYVIDTSTGHRALWHSGPYVPGAVQYAGAASISFTRDGSELVVTQARCHRSRYLSQCGGHADMQVRAYRQARRGGSLEAGHVLLGQASLRPAGTSLSGAFVTPDGRMLNALLMTCPKHGSCTLSVVQTTPGSLVPWPVLYHVRTGTRYQGVFIRFFGTDPSGRFLLLDAGAGKARVNGWIDHRRLVRLVPSDGDAVSAETW